MRIFVSQTLARSFLLCIYFLQSDTIFGNFSFHDSRIHIYIYIYISG